MGDVYLWFGFNGAFSDPNMWTDLSTQPQAHPAGPPAASDSAEFDKAGTVSGNGDVANLSVFGASLTFVGNISTESFSVTSQGTAYFNGGAVVNLGTGALTIGDDSGGTIGPATINGGDVAVQNSNLDVAFQGRINLTQGLGNFTVGEPQFTDLPSTLELDYGGSIIDTTAVIGGTSGASATVDGGTWTSTNGLDVGSSGSGTLAISLGGAVSTGAGGALAVGLLHGETGTVTVSGGGTLLSNYATDVVGGAGSGDLAINLTATASVAGTLDLGVASLAHGTLVVSDSRSSLSVGGALIIGDRGIATGTIANGASANATTGLTIGNQAGGSGTLTVTDTGTQFSVGGAVIGGSGSGTLDVQSGAAFLLNAGSIVVGAVHGGSGTVMLTGSLSTLSAANGLTIGALGFGSLSVQSDATASLAGGTFDVGTSLNATGIVALSGTGSALTLAAGPAVIGDGGAGTLTIASGALFADSTGATTIGGSIGGAGSMAVAGTAALANLGSLVVGGAGRGTLSVGASGSVTTVQDITIAAGTLSTGMLTVSGTGASLTDGGSLVVGEAGHGSLIVQSNGAVGATAGVLVLGDAKGSSGTVVLGGTLAGALGAGALAIGEGIIVGNAGAGTLDLQSNGELTLAAGIIEIGATKGGIGTLALAASGVTLTAPGALLVGGSGTGTLQVTAGSSLEANAGTLTIGAASGGVGLLTVSGAAAAASLEGLIIGAFGTATLAIASGAAAATPNAVVIGEGTGGFGTLTLNGVATSFIDGGDLVVGASGSGTVSVQGGATLQVNSGAVMIGAVAGAAGSVTLAGTGTPLQIGTNLTVGQSGTGTLNVQAGVTLDVNGGTVTLGTASGGSGTVMLTGSGATATLGSLVIGDAGSGSLSVGIGSSLLAQDITLGEITNGSGNLLVNGAGATARSSDLTIGLGGIGGLEVTTQGALDTTGAAVLGTEALPVVQQATVLSQAMWTVGGALTVGNAGNAIMVVGTGGTVFAGSVVLGDQSGASGTVTVSGTIGTGGSTFAASSLSFGGQLVVGNAGTADLTVSQDGIVGSPTSPAGTIEIGAQTGGVGSVSVSGAGSSLNAAVLAVGGTAGAAGGAGMLSIGVGATVDAGTAIVWGGGTIALGGGVLATDPITVDGEITGYGTVAGSIADNGTIVANGGTLTLPGSFSGLGTLAFGGVATLVLGTPGSGITLPVAGLAGGDRIEFAGLTITGAHVTSPGTVTISTTGANYLLTDVSFAPGAQQTFITGHDLAAGNGYIQVQCFAAGTHIAGPRGEVAVEALRVGDSVALAEGGVAEVVWIGRRVVNAAQHPQPRKVWPVRVAAGAFGAGMPHRDLFLSPDHAVFVEDVLIPVKRLINGSTIVQVPVDSVSYYHIELARHDVLLAEGLPVESYLDTGDRSDFANGGGPVRVHPDFNVLAWEALGCARLVITGPELDATRARIAAIAMHHSSRHRNMAQ